MITSLITVHEHPSSPSVAEEKKTEKSTQPIDLLVNIEFLQDKRHYLTYLTGKVSLLNQFKSATSAQMVLIGPMHMLHYIKDILYNY